MLTLVIMDGFGLRRSKYGNAIKASGTPNLKKLVKKYPHTKLRASGLAVGLPEGQMGNSEVGHLTIGSGRVNYQSLEKINRDIKSGEFFKRDAFVKALNHAKKSGRLHLMGLLSNGGVHSNISHLFAIIEQARKYDIKNIFVHAFLDGRDTPVDSGKNFLMQLQEFLKENEHIATIGGRAFGMDREKRYDRVEVAYKVLTEDGPVVDPIEAIEKSYEKGIFDEFVVPVKTCKGGEVRDGDSIIFFNYRADRAREITFAFTDKNFKEFKTKPFKNLLYTCMEQYADEFKDLNVIYPPETIKDNLASVISKQGLKQYHISETTKYAHVTFFLNGGIEEPYKGEDRKLIDSINTINFEYYPQMRAHEITTDLMDAIASQKYDFLVVNYSNMDMIGHTGNFNAAKKAADIVDKNVYAIALATLMAGGDCLIIADHGNGEIMFNENGEKVTSHTTSPVPCILVTHKKHIHLHKGGLANVAPTILKLMNIEIPKTMEKPLF